MFNNEEDVKIKLVVPLLLDLGFSSDKLNFEQEFTLRLGRNIYHNKKRNTARGRLDILCKYNEINLFVIETKPDSEDITQNDIDQAISYARLLDDIAPYVIVTNGIDTVVYDTITRKQLTEKHLSDHLPSWRDSGFSPSISELAMARYTALTNFVSFSPSNLTAFCTSFNSYQMKSLVESTGGSMSKYNKSIYAARSNLNNEFNAFLTSDSSIFAIVGDSGVGKSCSICNLCLTLPEEGFAPLFLNGTLLSKRPLEVISEELNYTFTETFDHSKTISRLESIAEASSSTVVLFIDAIDEIELHNIENIIGDLARYIDGSFKVKLCVTCKSSIWDKFLYIRTVPSNLYNALFRSDIKGINLPEDSSTPSLFFLDKFSYKELSEAEEKYYSAFNISGQFPVSLKEDLSLPIILRLTSEVSVNSEAPQSLNVPDLLFNYVLHIAEKSTTITCDTIIEILLTMCKLQVRNAREENDKLVSIRELKSELQLSVTDNLPTALFDYNLLKAETRSSQTFIAFNYTYLRDYIICTHLHSLSSLSDTKFKTLVPELFSNSIELMALKFYLGNPVYSHLEVIRQYIYTRAKEYVTTYTTILNTDFPNLKHLFEPYTDGDVGILLSALEFPISFSAGLFRMQEKHSDNVVICESDQIKLLIKKLGVPTYTTPFNLHVGSIENKARDSINSQLEEILEKKKLPVTFSTILSLEAVQCIVYSDTKLFSDVDSIPQKDVPRFAEIMPIRFHNIQLILDKYFARQYFSRIQVRKLVEEGKLKLNSRGGLSWSTSDLNSDELQREVDNAITTHASIPRVVNISPFSELETCLAFLRSQGQSELLQAVLPAPDIPVEEVIYSERSWLETAFSFDSSNALRANYSAVHFQEYLTNFFDKFDTAYAEVVNTAFPSIKTSLPFYSTLPHKFVINVKPYVDGNVPSIDFVFKKSDTESTVVCFDESLNMFDIFKNGDSSYIKGKGIYTQTLFDTGFSSSNFLYHTNKNISKYQVLWQWVGEQIADDFKNLQ